jgi:hypothetical protein
MTPYSLRLRDAIARRLVAAAIASSSESLFPQAVAPTEVFPMTTRDPYSKNFDIALAVRPAFALYVFKRESYQAKNVAADSGFTNVIRALIGRTMHEWRDPGDPRVTGRGSAFDQEPPIDPDFVPSPSKKKILTF